MRGRRFYLTTGLAALLLRVILMPFSLHIDPQFGGDLLAINGAAATFLADPHFGGTPYPPLAMWTIGLFQHLWRLPLPADLFSSLGPGFEAFNTPQIFYALFASKTLYLIFDLAAALLWLGIYRNEPRERRLAWLFWIFNPLILYNAYIHGQYDLLPVFFMVASLYFARRGQPRWAALWLGIGGCFKNFPLFFLLPLLIIFGKSWRERLVLLAIGALPYLVFMAPFLGEYRRSIGGYSNWYFRASYDLGFGAQVYLFVVFYAILLWYLYQRNARTFEDYWRAGFAILLIYFQFSYFDLHYWVWVIPFATIYWAEYTRQARPFYIAILVGLLVLTLPTPLARFLAPISPQFFLRLPSLMEVLNPYLPMLFIVNVVRSLLAGTCFYLAWRLLRNMPAAGRSATQAATGRASAVEGSGP